MAIVHFTSQADKDFASVYHQVALQAALSLQQKRDLENSLALVTAEAQRSGEKVRKGLLLYNPLLDSVLEPTITAVAIDCVLDENGDVDTSHPITLRTNADA